MTGAPNSRFRAGTRETAPPGAPAAGEQRMGSDGSAEQALDLDQARRFLAALDPDAKHFVFQTATDAEPKPDPDPLARVLNLPPDNLKPLVARNAKGAAIWVAINETDGKGRRVENVTGVRAVFADMDGAPLAPVLSCTLEPHLVVETSPGKYHAYWFVRGLAVEQFAGVQRRVAKTFGADPMLDLPRVMRLPGFVHQKDPAAPFVARIVHERPGLPYKPADVLRTFPPLQEEERAASRPGNGRASEPLELPAEPPEPLAPGRLAELQEGHASLFDLARYDGHHSKRDMALTGLVARLGWPPADAWALIIATREGLKGKERHKAYRRDYVVRTIARAYEQASAAKPEGEGDGLERAVERLAKLSLGAYEHARLEEAGRFNVRASILDVLVKAKREASDQGTAGQGRRLELAEIEPWAEPVDGATLLDGLAAHLHRFVVLSDHAASALALWAVHSHAHAAAFYSPRLALTSPVMRCGKSSVLRWLARVVPRALATSNISAPALFRVIEAAYPTLLIDELDQVDPDKKVELVGIVNSSHCRLDACVIRTVAVGRDDHEPRAFSTWAPIALAAIGRLPPTWMDRSVEVRMSRKLPGDRTEDMRLDRDQGFAELRRKCARWAADHLEDLRGADPEMPAGLNDRQKDNWRLMSAIAAVAGGQWPVRAKAAAIALSAPDDDADARGIQALADIRQVFEDRGEPESLNSDTIVSALVEMEGRPWAEYRRDGKPITKHALARLLKPFGIWPGNLRAGCTS